MLIASALALLMAGVSFIVYSLRTRRQALAKRVAIVLEESGPVPLTRTGADEVQTRLFKASRFSETETREMGRLLAKWQLAPDWAPALLIVLRGIGAAAFGTLTFIATRHISALAAASVPVLGLTFAIAVMGWFAVAWLLQRRAKNRVALIEIGLPDALELLVVCVEAGLSLEDAFDRTIAEIVHSRPELAEELALTSADLKIMPNRDDAFAKLADRVNLPSVKSLVTTLSQTMRYGTPLAQALRVVAQDLRNDSLLRLEERASELPVMLTVPMMLFIMPTIFLIVGGPAALRVADIFLR